MNDIIAHIIIEHIYYNVIMMSGSRMMNEIIYMKKKEKLKKRKISFQQWNYTIDKFDSFCESIKSNESDATRVMCHSTLQSRKLSNSSTFTNVSSCDDDTFLQKMISKALSRSPHE